VQVNHHRLNQRRLCCSLYLAEMYNFRVIDSTVVFNFLYSLVTYGVCYAKPAPPINALLNIDPPEHLFRIRLGRHFVF